MEDKKLQEIMKNSAEKVRPGRMFALKMRYRMFKKGVNMYFVGTGARLKFASAGLVVFLVMGGGVGTYAYTNPDVTVDHLLYPFKRGIENVEGGFTFSPEQKAGFHLKMAMRRMDEAEKLHERFKKNVELKDRAEAIAKTLEFMESEMDNSFMFVDGEFDVEKAEKVLNDFELKFGKMKERIGKLPPVENGKPHIKMVREKLEHARRHAGEKLELLGPAREAIMEARRANMKRVMLREFMENAQARDSY